jgi:hypothetical protein
MMRPLDELLGVLDVQDAQHVRIVHLDDAHEIDPLCEYVATTNVRRVPRVRSRSIGVTLEEALMLVQQGATPETALRQPGVALASSDSETERDEDDRSPRWP